MTTLPDGSQTDEQAIIGSRINRMDPNIFRNQLSADNDTTDNPDDDMPPESELKDGPADEDGDPTGERNHQDGN